MVGASLFKVCVGREGVGGGEGGKMVGAGEYGYLLGLFSVCKHASPHHLS